MESSVIHKNACRSGISGKMAHAGYDKDRNTPGMHPWPGIVKVLVVDDDPFSRHLMKSLLRLWNIKADLAENGQEAVSLLRRGTYDIVLMDIEMPVMNGLEAARLIRAEMDLNIPVIAVSANSTEEDRRRAFESGMDDFLQKPFGHAELKARITVNMANITAPAP